MVPDGSAWCRFSVWHEKSPAGRIQRGHPQAAAFRGDWLETTKKGRGPKATAQRIPFQSNNVLLRQVLYSVNLKNELVGHMMPHRVNYEVNSSPTSHLCDRNKVRVPCDEDNLIDEFPVG